MPGPKPLGALYGPLHIAFLHYLEYIRIRTYDYNAAVRAVGLNMASRSLSVNVKMNQSANRLGRNWIAF
jgi:hypothetical protein